VWFSAVKASNLPVVTVAAVVLVGGVPASRLMHVIGLLAVPCLSVWHCARDSRLVICCSVHQEIVSNY
jgi:hypothetical protein